MNNFEIAYLICNPTLNDPRLRQAGPISPEIYLKYLINSLKTLFFYNQLKDTNIKIYLAQAVKDKGYEKSVNKMLQSFASRKIELITINDSEIFKKYSENINNKLNASELHQILNYYIIKNSPADLLLICDADTLFLKKEYINSCSDFFQQSQNVIAGFFQKPFTNDSLHIEPRIHSVFTWFDLKKLRQIINLEIIWQALIKSDNYLLFDQLKSKALKKSLYDRIRYGAYKGDTFTELTYYFLYDSEEPKITNLADRDNYFYDLQYPFTLGNEYFIHGKYYDKKIIDSMLLALSQNMPVLENFKNTFQILKEGR